MSEDERLTKVAAIAEAAIDLGAEEIVALDVRKLTSFADTFLILTASSNRRARAIADSIGEAMVKRDENPRGVEGHDEGRWILIDLDDVIVHIFLDDVRREYDLERLWSDAPVIDVAGAAARAAAR
jgi:ribosome-associated protein